MYQDNIRSSADEVQSYGFSFDFGRYFDAAWQLWKKNIWEFAGFAVILIILSLVLGLIPFLGSIVSSLIVTPCMVAGFYMVARKKNIGEPTEFGNYFDGFKLWKPLAAIAAIQLVIYLLLMSPLLGKLIPLFMEMQQMGPFATEPPDFPDIAPYWFLLVIPMIYLAVSWIWAPLFVVFGGYGPWEAMETSRKIISKNWFMMFIFILVAGIISAAGAIACGVGILITITFAYCAIYSSFDEVIGLSTHGSIDDEIDNLGETEDPEVGEEEY